MQTVRHKKSQYYQVICSTYLIVSFSYKFMSSLGWFCLLMLLLPQVSDGEVRGFRVPDKQHSLSSAKSLSHPFFPPLMAAASCCHSWESSFSPFFPKPFSSPDPSSFPRNNHQIMLPAFPPFVKIFSPGLLIALRKSTLFMLIHDD